jgi:hypothetical protein
MKTHIRLALACLLILVGTIATAQGEVKSVKMKIDGYLCGM